MDQMAWLRPLSTAWNAVLDFWHLERRVRPTLNPLTGTKERRPERSVARICQGPVTILFTMDAGTQVDCDRDTTMTRGPTWWSSR
jgi:hypothetical protein